LFLDRVLVANELGEYTNEATVDFSRAKLYNLPKKKIILCLQGWVQFPTGGETFIVAAREPNWVDPVQYRSRQYSLDERRSGDFAENNVFWQIVVVL